MQVNLFTALPMDECVRRIDQAANPPTTWSSLFETQRQVRGEVEGNRLTLQHKPVGRNSFAPALHATLIPEREGTRIQGDCAISSWVEPFMGCWLGFGGLVGLIAIPAALYRLLAVRPTDWSLLAFLFGPPIVLLFGLGLRSAGRSSAEEDASEIVAFLQKLLDAKSVDGDA